MAIAIRDLSCRMESKNRMAFFMKRHLFRILRPGIMVALISALMVGLVAFSAYELRESRRIIIASMEQGAVSLMEAMARAGENALRADAEIEALAAERHAFCD